MAVDQKPGMGASEKLNAYWLGEGLVRWADSPTPWRALRGQLLEYMSIDKANGLATELFHAHFGFYPAQEHKMLHPGTSKGNGRK